MKLSGIHFLPVALFAIAFSSLAHGGCTGTATSSTCTSASGFTFPNAYTAPPNSQKVSVYPSTNTVSGMSGTITSIAVKLNTLNHTAAQDTGFMLVAPNGTTNLVFMSNTGGNGPSSNVTVTIADSGINQIARDANAGMANGATYKPKSDDRDNVGPIVPPGTENNASWGYDVFFLSPAPTPKFSGPRDSTNPTLNGTFGCLDPNGDWKLYAVQAIAGDGSSLSLGSWSVIITTASLTGTSTTLTTNLNPVFTTSPNNSATLTATVTSGGSPVTTGSVTFSDGASAVCSVVALNGSGVATCAYTPAAQGTHLLSAVYSGTASLAASNSNTISEQVDIHTTNPSAGKYCNVGSISLPTTGQANVYPSHIYIPGAPGTIQSVSLQLAGVTTTDMSTIAALLVSPDGAVFSPLNGVGQAGAESGVTFTLQDGSTAAPFNGSLINNTTYGPAAYGFKVPFPSPAPTPTTAQFAATIGTSTFASAFGGALPNGSGGNLGQPWSLYIANGSVGQTATIASGWCLSVTLNKPQLTVTKTHTGPGASNAFIVNQNGTYTISVGSSGPGSTGGSQVTVNDNLPTGFTILSILAGVEWNCTGSTTTAVLCTTSNTLATGSHYSDIVVTVKPDSTAGTTNVQNTAAASGTGLLTGNGTDTSTVLHAPTLSLSVTDSGAGTFSQGDLNRTFAVTLTNTAGAPTSGTVTLNLNLSDATALIPQSLTSSPVGWVCSGPAGTYSCTINLAVSAGSSFPVLTLTVNVAANATSPQTLSASASGGGGNSPTASDTVTVLKTQTITFAQPSDHVLADTPVTLPASASSGLTVSFISNSTSVCTTTSTGVVTLVAAGACSISVSQAGNASFTAATPVTRTFQVNKNSQAITFNSLLDRVFGTAPFALAATASSSLAVSFASTTPAVCTVAGSTVTLLAVGQCTIEATQAGNATFSAATPVDQSFSVTPASQTITFTQPLPATFGSAPNPLSATASSGLTVTFTSTTPAVCTVSGVTVTLVGVGQCGIQADQAGTANYIAAPPVTRSFTISQASQSITFLPPLPQVFGAAPFNVSATATSGLAVSFASLTQAVCTVTGNTVTIVTTGQCTVEATQAGNANYAAATPVDQSFPITHASQTITFAPPSNQVFGTAPITLSATASSGLPVTFVSLSNPVCTVSGSTVTLIAAGQCSIQATQPGDINYFSAPPVTQLFQVTQASQTITFNPLTDVEFGSGPFGVSATASSGLAVAFSSTTPAVCTAAAAIVSVSSVGQCTIVAAQAGNTNYQAATSVARSFNVTQASQTILFSALGPKTLGDPPFAVSATATSGLSVGFASTTPSVCSVVGTTVTILGAGPCNIRASQAGNANYAAATPVDQPFTVNQAAQTITFGALGNKVFGASPFSVSATSSSGLTVSFNSQTPAVCTVAGTTVTLVTGGNCTIQATQPGNTNYSAATPVTQGFTVTQAPQTITFGALSDKVFGSAPSNVSATSTSGLTVAFNSQTPAVCTVAGTTVTLVGAGNCTVQATQAGNTNFSAAAPVNQGFQVTQAAQTITFGALADQVLGTPAFPVSATSSSGLPVMFSTLTPGICTVAASTVTLTNLGICTLHATQIGSANYLPAIPVDRSFQVLLTPPGGQSFVTGQIAGTVRNNFSGFVGMQFTVGATAINVTQLGRIFLTGNSGTHTVKLVNAMTGADVAGGSVPLAMTPGTPNTYEFATLPSPVQLLANTSYYVVSQEITGGDTWFDYTPVTHTTAAVVNGPVYQSGPTSYVQVPSSPNYSFVPVSFLYNVASVSPPPAVTITAPADTATVSGNAVLLSATATAAPSLSITGVQFKVDTNTLIGTPVLNPPYQINWDSTSLADGVHTLTAVATDNIGGSTTSAPVLVNVSNGTVQPTGTEFVTGATFGALRNNSTTYVGMQFTVGAQNLTLNALGRVYVAGNTGTHIVKLVNATNGLDVPGGSVTLNMAGGTAFRFKYASLASPLILPAGTSYYVVSQETSGGDQWYDYAPVTMTGVAGINGPVFLSGGNYNLVPSAINQAFVPVNFLYTVSVPVNTPPTVSITAPSAGAASGTISFNATATANGGLLMKSLQLKLDGNNYGNPSTIAATTQQISNSLNTTTLTNGPHTLTAVGVDTANNMAVSPPVVINVNNATPPSSVFITGQTFGTPRNNFSGFVGMKFTTGPTALNVTQLGRVCIAGNSLSHTLKLVLASNSGDVAGGSLSIDMTGCTAGQYKYLSLGSPVSLSANTSYELVSLESNGGDQWYDYAPVTAAAAVGTVNGPVYSSGATFTLVPSPGYSYVPVNFQYTVSNNPPPSVTITAPVAGPVSGTLTITANATAANGLTIQSVQFKQNGTNIGAPVTGPGPNYSTQLDTTALINGATYNLTAVANDSAAGTATSATVAVTVNNNAPPAGSPLILGQTFGTVRNNFTGFVGMQFTSTGTPVVANSLGRICVAGNAGSHALKLVKSDGTDLPGGSTTVSMAGCTPGQYKYAALTIPLQLSANTTYYLVSQELAGGDQWYDYAPVTPAAAVATVNGPVYFAGGYQLVPSPGYSYVPVNLLYQ